MINTAKPNASAGKSISDREFAAIGRVLKSSFGGSEGATAFSPAPYNDAGYFDPGSAIADMDDAAKPCPDKNHHVSLIDVAGPSAAAIVEFTDCSGAAHSDLYVLQKLNSQWAISQKVWDSHAHS